MSGSDLPRADAAVYATGFDFLLPYLEPFGRFVDHPDAADFILTMNSFAPGAAEALADLKRWGKPLVWWTVEDPNSFEAFLDQAAGL